MLKTNSTDLAQALSFLYQAYANKTTMPIMQNVKLSTLNGWLHMTQQSNEQELTYKIPCDGDELDITVEMKKFKERVSQYPKNKDVSITLDEESNKAVVKCGRSKITLNTMSSKDYPDSKEPASFDTVTFNGAELKRALTVVKGAQANNDVRHYLNGVDLELGYDKCNIVATDGHRLHHAKISVQGGPVEGRTCIIPRDSISPIHKFLEAGDIQVRISDNALRISDEESSIQTQLVDGRFPDWKRVVPSNTTLQLTFNKDDLEQALKGCLVASNEKFKAVRLTVEDGFAKFESNAPDGSSSEEVVECAMSGVDRFELGFNGVYMLESIAAVESENVEILGTSADKPMLIKDGNYQAVVMPMRL